jgi:hypothetical protein
MGLPIFLKKVDAAQEHLLYAFGSPEDLVGRLRLDTATGDIEVVSLSEPADGPDTRYYLAQVVPRLQAFHDEARYPDTEQWTA